MLTERTTLILGAGASAPYGFPLGIGLRNLLLEYNDQFIKVVQDVEYSHEAWDATRRLFLRSQYGSVDDFLRKYPDVGYVIKLAVLDHLNTFEVLEDHCDARIKDRWYPNLIFDFMSDDPSLLSGLLTIITFNYDLSLEMYLCATLQARHNMTPPQARAAVGKLPIIHIHGDIGPLQYLEGSGRPYGRIQAPSMWQAASQRIITLQRRGK